MDHGTECRVASITSTTLVLEGDFDGNDQLALRPDREAFICSRTEIVDIESDVEAARATADDAESDAAEAVRNQEDAEAKLEAERAAHAETKRQLGDAIDRLRGATC